MARPKKYQTKDELRKAKNENNKRAYEKRNEGVERRDYSKGGKKPEPKQNIKRIRNKKPLPIDPATGRIMADKHLGVVQGRQIDLNACTKVEIRPGLIVYTKKSVSVEQTLETYKDYVQR